MKVFATILFLYAFLALIAGKPNGPAGMISIATRRGPHEVYNSCGSCHLDSCTGRFDLYPLDCDYVRCWSGYYCEEGYIRESPTGLCILPSECP